MWLLTTTIAAAEDLTSIDGVQMGVALDLAGWTCSLYVNDGELREACWRNSVLNGHRGQTKVKLHGGVVVFVAFHADFASREAAIAAYTDLVQKVKVESLGWSCWDFSRPGVNANGATCSLGSRHRLILRTMENGVDIMEGPVEASESKSGL